MIDKELNYGRQHIEAFLRKIANYESVLDLGAGHGDDLMLAKKTNPKATLFAIECYRPYKKELESKNIKVIDLNIENGILPFEDNSVDIIICNQILEHCKEIFWIFNEISRVLKMGGHLIIGVPNLASLHNRLLLLLGYQPTIIKNDSAHVRGYTKNDILKFLNSCFEGGYKLTSYGGSNFYPFPPILAKPLSKLLPNMSWGIFLLLEKKKEFDNDFITFPKKKQLETNFYLGKHISVFK